MKIKTILLGVLLSVSLISNAQSLFEIEALKISISLNKAGTEINSHHLKALSKKTDDLIKRFNNLTKFNKDVSFKGMVIFSNYVGFEGRLIADNMFCSDAMFTNATFTESVKAKTINASKVVLNVGSFPDYVFDKNYNLMPLKQVKAFINSNKRLPNMPSEAEVIDNGMSVGELNVKLVEKIEELTLYILEQEDRINDLAKELHALKTQ